MNKVLKIVRISENLMTYVQRLEFELNGYKNIMASIVSAPHPYTQENYDKFMEQYQDTNAEFRLVVGKVLEDFAPEYGKRNDILLNFIYVTGEVEILERSDSCHA
jgi:cupin superfamily acireductone dioxygenase involved in methionine salvage